MTQDELEQVEKQGAALDYVVGSGQLATGVGTGSTARLIEAPAEIKHKTSARLLFRGHQDAPRRPR